MLEVACKDVGAEDCAFVARGEKTHKVEDALLEHLRDVHPELVVGLDIAQHEALEHRVKAAIRAA